MLSVSYIIEIVTKLMHQGKQWIIQRTRYRITAKNPPSVGGLSLKSR